MKKKHKSINHESSARLWRHQETRREKQMELILIFSLCSFVSLPQARIALVVPVFPG